MSNICVLVLGVVALIINLSCTSGLRSSIKPATRPLVNKYEKEPILTQTDTLNLEQAVYLALLKNPELQVYSFEIRAREAGTLQASFAPNPGIEIEVENFGGSGELGGLSGSEITITVGQLIEFAGKRDKRTRAAAFQSDLAAWDYEAKKLEVLTETVKRYVQLIGDQEQIVLNRELVGVSEKLFQAVNRLVQAGKISPAEISRTQIMLSTAQLELNKSIRNFAADRIRLASLWGDTSPGYNSVAGTLKNITIIPPADSLKRFLPANQDLMRWDTEIEFRQVMETLEEAKQIPDPSIQAGYRYISGPDLNAFVAGLSIPLPVSDNNEGAVQEAYIRRKQAEEQRKQTEVLLNTHFEDLYQNLLVLHTEIDQSNKIIIPEAEKAYRIIQDGYLTGKFRFLDVLDAQRTLFETRKNLIASLTEYNMRVADLERLIGRPLSSVDN